VRRFLEVDDNLRQLLRHALAGAQVERHTRPAPVADIGAQRDKGLGVALGVGVFFLQVTRHRLAFAVTGDVLAAHHLGSQAFGTDRGQGLEHFDLLVANAVSRQVSRRVHRNQAQQLQQVVLNHVAQLAGLVEVAPAALDADFLGHGDFNVGDVALVPLGLEQAVGKTQRDQVLYGFLAQVVVDPVGAVLGEELRHGIVDLARGLQIRADGFFQHHAGVFSQTDGGQVLAYGAVHCRRCGEISDQALLGAGQFSQGEVIFSLEKIHMQIAQASQEALQRLDFDVLFAQVLAQLAVNMCQVRRGVARLASQCENARIGMQQAGTVQLVQGRKQLAQGQIAKGAEQGKGARFNRNRRHDVGSFIKLSYKYLFSRYHSRKNVVINTTFSENTDSC